MGNFWETTAKRWDDIGSPFRPGARDQQYMEHIISNWSSQNGPARVLVLGSTPEMAHLNMPNDIELLAVDRCQKMIDQVWPGFPKQGEGALCANWLDLPIEEKSRDIVLSDGPFNTLRYSKDHKSLFRSIRRVLKPGGVFAFRVFIQPKKKETPETVFNAAMNGNIESFHSFKFRLAMALQHSVETGIRFSEIWNAWAADGPDANKLAAQSGWTVKEISTIKAYRDADFVFTCPTLQELSLLLREEGFRKIKCFWPTYEMGERCPTLVLTHQDKKVCEIGELPS